ncbi:MAG: quinone-dependent dihydroorotate dehydrogenase [Candidatus Halichondribacter symbioticus]
MKPSERIALHILHRLDAERAHDVALFALRNAPSSRVKITTHRLRTTFAGLTMPNPIGLAAGLDKNARAIKPLLNKGFGFIEVGAITPLPQNGNPKPRLFRLAKDKAIINRFGFNNDGAATIAERLKTRPKHGILGINLGANKDSKTPASDYVKVLQTCAPHADFATINVSSPNTKGLRDLQKNQALPALLEQIMEARESLPNHPPIFLKIAPDLTQRQIAQIAQTAMKHKIDGIIATNTTVDRPNLTDKNATETGGLSGQPLFEKSTRVLARLAKETDGKIPLIGVGGVSNAAQAFAKIQAGATAVQLYSALVYGGLDLIREIAEGLDILLTEHGYDSIEQATGSAIDKWL